MPNGNLQEHRNESRNKMNISCWIMGFASIRNSSLYKKGNSNYVLSPGISKGEHTKVLV